MPPQDSTTAQEGGEQPPQSKSTFPKRSKGPTAGKEVAAKAPLKPRIPGRRRKHADMPPEGTPAHGAYVAETYGNTVKNLAAAAARQDPRYQGRDSALTQRKAGRLFALNQLDEDQVEAIEVDYRSGALLTRSLCQKHTIHPSTLYKLAHARGWPSREQLRQALLDSIDDKSMKAAVNEMRMQNGQPLLPADTNPASGSPESGSGGSPTTAQTLDQAKTDVIIEGYATAVAAVLDEARKLSGTVVGIGRDLLDTFQEQVAGIRKDMADAVAAEANGRLKDRGMQQARAETLAKLATTYTTLVRSIQMAIDMQRQAFALDGKAGKGMGLAPDQQPAQQPGIPQGPKSSMLSMANVPPADFAGYEAIVRHAEEQGIALN